MRSFYLRHFDPKHQEKKYEKFKDYTEDQIIKVWVEVQKPGSAEVCNCSLRQKAPCTGSGKEQLHLSSLNLLAPISVFFLFGLLLMYEKCSLICFQCGGPIRNGGCREVATQQNMQLLSMNKGVCLPLVEEGRESVVWGWVETSKALKQYAASRFLNIMWKYWSSWLNLRTNSNNYIILCSWLLSSQLSWFV